jgi:heme exporter protein D
MSEFFAMGGYAPYVWTAYGITLVVVVLNVWSARRRHAQALLSVRRMTESEKSERRPTVRRNP